MAPRAYWTGNLRISLVTFGIRMYNAVSEAERVRLNQVHKGCNTRIKMPVTCPIHGPLERSEIAKAYEFEKDKFVIIEQQELDAIKLRSEKTIDIEKFVPEGSVDEVYLDSTYYVAPDGPVAEEPFRVVRAALEEAGAVGVGKITLGGRERAVLLKGSGKGFAISTLHAAAEVRPAEPYFEEIRTSPVDAAGLRLAVSLINSKMGEFDAEEFRDRYQDALVSLIKSKIEGDAPVIVQEEEIPVSFNFMEALKQSLGRSEDEEAPAKRRAKPAAAARVKAGAKKPPAKSQRAAAAKAPAKKRKQA